MAQKQYPIINNFSKGELSPRMEGRVDIQGYYNGCKIMQNCIMVAQGGAEKRPGTIYIGEVYDSSSEVKLIPFEVNDSEIYILEVGHMATRIWDVQKQDLVQQDATTLILETPYKEGEISSIQYATTEGRLFLAHQNYPFQYIVLENNRFRLEKVVFEAKGWKTGSDYIKSQIVWNGGEYFKAINDITNSTVVPSSSRWTIGTPVGASLSGDYSEYTVSSFTSGDIKIYNGSLWKALRSYSGGEACYPGIEIYEFIWQDTDTSGGLDGWHFRTVYSWERSCISYVSFVCYDREPYQTFIERSYNTNHRKVVDFKWVWDVVGAVCAWRYQYKEYSSTVTSDPYWEMITPLLGGTDTKALIEYDGADTYAIGDVVYDTDMKQYQCTEPGSGLAPGATPEWTLIENPFFSKEGDYPAAVAFMNQRLFLGGTKNHPQTLYGSRIGSYIDFNIGIDADDPFIFEIADDRSSRIKWIVGKDNLMIGTTSSEWLVTGTANATNVQVLKQSAYGSAYNQAIMVADSLLFYQKGGRKLREYMYSNDNKAYLANDLTFFADHITGNGIDESSYQQNPDSILWNTKRDGGLVGLTYDRLNGISGWHKHSTLGMFESVVAIDSTGEEDELWFVVKRYVNGVVKRYIEKMAKRIDNSIYSDSNVSYSAGSIYSITSITRYSTDLTLGTTLDSANTTVINVGTGNIPNGTPQTGSISVTMDTGTVRYVPYLSHDNDDEFTISSTDWSGTNKATSGANVLLGYIEVDYLGSSGISNGDSIKFFSTESELFDYQVFQVGDISQGASSGTFSLYKNGKTAVKDIFETITTGSFSLVTKIVTGLDHLLGQTVSILGDGAVFPNQEVIDNIDGIGGIGVELSTPCNSINCGLPYQMILQPESIELQGTLGAKSRISSVKLKLYKTLGGSVGPDVENTQQITYRTSDINFGSPPSLFTGTKTVNVDATSDNESVITIVHNQPLPMTVLAIISDISYSRS